MYKKLCTEFYDLEPHRDEKKSLAFYMQRAHEARGPILEPMCGTGRFLIPMLEAGLDCEGFDASAHMLDAFREKYIKISPLAPPIRELWAQDFTSGKRYTLIFVPYGSWGLITNLEDAKKCLTIMYHHLAPGGKFIIEIETVASVPDPCGVWRRGVHTRPDGSKIAVNALATFNPATQIYSSLCKYELLINGVITEIESEDFKMYLYRFDEIDELLKAHEFSDIKKYQDYSLAPAHDTLAPIVIYECTK